MIIWDLSIRYLHSMPWHDSWCLNMCTLCLNTCYMAVIVKYMNKWICRPYHVVAKLCISLVTYWIPRCSGKANMITIWQWPSMVYKPHLVLASHAFTTYGYGIVSSPTKYCKAERWPVTYRAPPYSGKANDDHQSELGNTLTWHFFQIKLIMETLQTLSHQIKAKSNNAYWWQYTWVIFMIIMVFHELYDLLHG